jgi:type IV pilus assembly protein PilQ
MKQVLRTTGNLAFALIVLAAFAASNLYAGEITGVESQNQGDSVVVSVLADEELEYSDAVDYAEWLLRVDFPGATLGTAAQASIYDFPQEVADWVSGYRLERTEAGSRLVLVLGERAVPLKIRIDREGNRLGIIIPTGDGAAENVILVPLGFTDPPATFWEVAANGSYRVMPLALETEEGGKPVQVTEVEPTPRPEPAEAAKPAPAPEMSAGLQSFLIPPGIEKRPENGAVLGLEEEAAPVEAPRSFDVKSGESEEATHNYSYSDFAPRPKPAPAAEATPAVEEKPEPAAEPVAAETPKEEAAVSKAPEALAGLPKEELMKLAEAPGETVLTVDEQGATLSEEAESFAPEVPPEAEAEVVDPPKFAWVPSDERRKRDQEEGRGWGDGPNPWDVGKDRMGPPLPPKSFLEESPFERERITFECVDAPIAQAITLMVTSTPFNVIVESGVSEAKVTLSFKDTPLMQALDTVTAANNLLYTIRNDTIIVGTRDNIGRRLGGYVTRTFRLDYSDAESVKQVLVDNGIVAETNIGVYNGESIDLGIKTGGTYLSEGEGGVNAGDIREITSLLSTARSNTLVVTETPERMETVARIIEEIDHKPRQVTLETSIVELTETGMKTLGFEIPNTTNIPINEGPGASATGIPLGTWMQTLYRDPMSIAAVLNHQIELGNARILSRPNLSSIDGRQAIYFAGRLIPYITRPAVETGGTYTPPQVEFQAIGIVLSFKPRVDRDGAITIEVNPSVSTLLRFVDVGQGTQAPESQTRQVTATVRVRDKETFVIAGLLSEEERENLRKVPLLSEIPLFGELFTKRETSKERTEIMVFVTPVLHD